MCVKVDHAVFYTEEKNKNVEEMSSFFYFVFNHAQTLTVLSHEHVANAVPSLVIGVFNEKLN